MTAVSAFDRGPDPTPDGPWCDLAPAPITRPVHTAIARALFSRPKVLLCDEPTGNLDEASAEMVAGLLLELHARQQTMLIVVTHSATLAARFPLRYELRHANLHPAGA